MLPFSYPLLHEMTTATSELATCTLKMASFYEGLDRAIMFYMAFSFRADLAIFLYKRMIVGSARPFFSAGTALKLSVEIGLAMRNY